METAFHCQHCRNPLHVTAVDRVSGRQDGAGLLSPALGPPSLRGGECSESGTARIDESFVMLEDRKGASGAAGAMRSLGESFVLLKGQAAQVAGGGNGAGHLDAQLEILTRVFELASQEAQVDHPLCLECSEELRAELDTQLAEANNEVLAFEDALERLLQDNTKPMSNEAFDEEMRQLQDTEAAERQRCLQLQAQLGDARAEAAQLEAAAVELDALEERYWHDFNDFKTQLRAHVEERDALLSKIDRAASELERLRCTNVYNDAFHIWYDGPFGTISGFRLGRTPAHPVDWTEINAAWGQATLLLHTMANACGLQFSGYRLIPVGSHPRIADRKNTYDLFGPPKMWSGNYDKAIVCFLTCLQEFAEFAHGCDSASGREPVFELHYPIEGDKVGGVSVKMTFNKEARWTKALKYMLTNLKLCLKWMIERQEAADEPVPAVPTDR
mmetsp:Transcript_8297/g.23802  ORF Transcript_8297/g.23802 Transcript_8297/m.23802 type:complete len:444 (-) Transcript_8297:467-1798(-)